ncbi:MAG: HAMP domain-containing protein [Myxococcales bacterium]|nr:HAMP domain-containing protein [Myxococcales bacterium]
MSGGEERVTLTGAVRALDPARELRWHGRFQVRLLAYLLLFSLAISLTAGYIYYTRQVKFVEAEQKKRGRTLISNLAGQSELGAYSGDRAFLTAPARRVFNEPDVSYVAIYDRRGRRLIRLAKPGVDALEEVPPKLLTKVLADNSGQPTVRKGSTHDDLIAPIVSVRDDSERGLFGSSDDRSVAIGVARLGLSRRPAQAKLRAVLRWGIYLSLIILSMGAALALLLARRISSPILELVTGADELRRGQLGYQIIVDRKDELGLLAEMFNRMSANLQRTIASLADLNRNLEQEVARRTVALRRSRDFIVLLNAPLQLGRLLDSALDALVRITGATAGATYIHEPRKGIELAVCQGLLADAFAIPADAPDALTKPRQLERAVVLSPLPSALALAARCPDAKALVVAPLRYRERLEGLVTLVMAQAPDRDQMDFVTHASSQLAIAVANARAFAEAERLARELEQRNVALLQQRDQLQEVNRLKSEFLANVSHELRTPLNAIVGYTELIHDGIYGDINDDQRQALSGIQEASQNLLVLINDILDLSKVEAGKMELAVADTDMAQVVREVVEFSAPLSRDRPYEVSIRVPESPLVVRTDAGKVRQVLVNLVSNAIKFTAEGSVELHVDKAASGGARITVADTGVGIREEDLKVIFEEFRQVDGSSTREHGGTGLGLAISKKLAELLGGELSVKSTFGVGSSFTFVVPAIPPGEKRRRPKTMPELAVVIGERVPLPSRPAGERAEENV